MRNTMEGEAFDFRTSIRHLLPALPRNLLYYLPHGPLLARLRIFI